MKRISWIVALVVLLALAGGAAAQDELTPQATPAFASLYLEAGFALDPYLVRVESSGTLDAATVREGCVGVIPAAPDVVVTWAGAADQLSFFVYSDVDPVLLVVTPAGDILCNDDWNDTTLNPVVSVPAPADGEYAVYVGAYSADQLAYGWLGVTQMAPETLEIATADLSPMLELRMPAAAAPLDVRPAADLAVSDEPIFGAAVLDAGFNAYEASVTAAGVEAAPLFALGDAACAGYINLAPSFAFALTSSTNALNVLFQAESDAALIVRLPDGSFVCNADAAADNLNPRVLVEAAPAGDYFVWVGTMTPDSVAPGTLIISEDAVLQPDLLAAGQ